MKITNNECRVTNTEPLVKYPGISDLKERIKKFALDVMRFSETFSQKRERWALTQQLIRSASSVGANYRAACRSRSVADFLSKMSIVEEEADETMYWLELLEESGLSKNAELQRLKDEANQLVAITVASKKTARANHS